MDFDPANGGRLRASTQAVEGTNVNALEVCLTYMPPVSAPLAGHHLLLLLHH